MQKPNGYDETPVTGSWETPEVGGHYLQIKKVVEKQSSTNKAMIVVYFDFAMNDKQPGLFMKSFEEDIRPDKKWPYAGTKYIMVNDYQDLRKTSKNFKAFVTAVEGSNPNFITTWGDNWGNQFKNKFVGGVFGEVENEYNGKRTTRSELRWFCSIDSVPKAKTPAPKLMKDPVPAAAPSTSYDGFYQVPDDDDDGVPFG